MAKTTLKPWSEENVLVEVETTEVLTEEEKETVKLVIRGVFLRRFEGELWPSHNEIKCSMKNKKLAEKIISIKYC